MKKLMKKAAVILGLSLLAITTTNASTPKTKAAGEICYWFSSKGLDGEWTPDLLVSKKKLTYKQAHAFMKKEMGMPDNYEIEVLPDDECDVAVSSFGNEPDGLYYYKEPKAEKTTNAKAQVKKTTAATK